MFPIRLSPQTFENTTIYSLFFNISMFQCRWPHQTYIQEILPIHCLSQCFCTVSRQKHGNLHVFRHKVGPKTFQKHPLILVSVRNRFCPPPAKADIAIAILTNVIEYECGYLHPISTPSPPKRCGRNYILSLDSPFL